MNTELSNLFKISLSAIKKEAKELNELETEKVKNRLAFIKTQIAICEKILGETNQSQTDWEELVIARLKCLPSSLIFSMGSWEGNSLGMIKEVKAQSDVGKLIVEMEKNYFKTIKEGKLLGE